MHPPRHSLSLLVCLGLMLLVPAPLTAAQFFTEDFSDNSAGPNMGLGTGHGAPTTDFTGDFTITSGANSRIYLGTNDTDYSTVSFTYDALVTVPNTTNPWAITFFGMGNRNAVGGGAFGEPTTTPNALINLRNDLGWLIGGDNASPTLSTAYAQGIGNIPNNTHALRMTWNATTKQATIGVDIGNTGNGYNSTIIDGSNNGFSAANSQLLLGGGNGLTFDNISVTSGATAPTAILFDINSGASPTATGATFAATGVTGDLSNGIVVSAPGSVNSAMSAGGVTLNYLSGAANQTADLTGGGLAVNPLLDDYLTFFTGGQSGPATMEISGLADGIGFDLESNYEYTLYLFGTAGTALNQNSTFTFDGVSLTTGAPTGVGDAALAAVAFDFRTYGNLPDSLTFDWARVGSNQFGAFNGFAIVRGQQVPEPGSIALWSLLGLALLGWGWRSMRGRNVIHRNQA